MLEDRILADGLREIASAEGIDLIGFTSGEPFTVPGGVYRHVQPAEVLPGARSVVVAGFCALYETDCLPSKPGMPRGRFTPYGSRVFMPMSRHCTQVVKRFLEGKGYKAVSAPGIPVKPAAVRAGLGRYGKSGVVMTESESLGSWVMFECLVTDAPLAGTDRRLDAEVCGACSACLKACPTGAICAPYRVDRAKCITDWLWGTFVPPELRVKQGDRLFGCGECLRACPRNAAVSPRTAYPAKLECFSDSPELIPLATADASYYREVMPSFPRQAGVENLRGNVLIALGNEGDPTAVDVLRETLRRPEVKIRTYSAWALGRIGGAEARAILTAALASEEERQVREEIERVLAALRSDRG